MHIQSSLFCTKRKEGFAVVISNIRSIIWLSLFSLFLVPADTRAQQIDWPAVEDETVRLMQEYLRIDTTNPPGNVAAAARFLLEQLQQGQVPAKLYWTEKETGRVNVLARLSGSGRKRPLMLLHHMTQNLEQ